LARRAVDWVIAELEGSGTHEQLSDLYVSARLVREAVYALADDLDAAAGSAVETYEIAGRIPNRTVRSMTASALGQIHLMRGEYAELLRRRPFGGRLRGVLVSTTLGDVAARLGHAEEAEGWYRRAMGLAESIGARSGLAIATLGAAELARVAGTRPPSTGQLEQALAIFRALRLEHYR